MAGDRKPGKAARSPSWAQHLVWRLEAFGYDLLTGLLRALPVEAASGLGGWIMRRLGPLSSADAYARTNIRFAFPDMGETEVDRLMRAQWDNTGRVFAELAFMDRLTVDSGRLEVVHGERLDAIRESGRPVVFISGHFANWELMPAVILHKGVTCHITYRPANNPYVDERVKKSRARYGVELFAPKGESARDLIVALKTGQSIALMVDQKFNTGLMVPLFGKPAPTNPGAVRLALQCDAPLVPMSAERLDGARFRITVHEAIPIPRTGDRAADVAAGVAMVNAFVEERVRANPKDWFWVHRRWPKADYPKR